MMPSLVATLLTALIAWPAPAVDHFSRTFDAEQDGEAIATVHAGCSRCDWSASGREAAVLRVTFDGRYSQHLVLTRGESIAEYRIALGKLKKGRHYAPAPFSFLLDGETREAVMDSKPWTYAIAAAEMRREGKVAEDPPPGLNKIADPRRFVDVEACGTVGNAALSLSIGVGDQWIPSDRGLPQYRIVRDGCFTIATPLPVGTRPADILAIQVRAFERPPAEGKPRVAADPVTFTRINKVFMLDEHDLPAASILKWEGSQTIRPGGDRFEIRIR